MDPELFKAATSGEIAFLERVTPDEESENSNGDIPLHVAAGVGCIEIVLSLITSILLCGNPRHTRQLLAYNKDLIQKTNRDEDTALHCAARNGHHDVVKCLMNVDPELSSFVNCIDGSPLYLNPKAFSAFIIFPTEQNLKHFQHISFMYISGNPMLVGLLNEPDNDGNTPLHLAVIYQEHKIIDILARDKRVNLNASTCSRTSSSKKGSSKLAVPIWDSLIN
ncbi:ankyrin repeat-containing protein, putative [Ricinus communis]|uniref:Ankyrin repeat-containing protein, putative n=1 Tax=Ricinus communis TaxID=3988 RepID=B9RY77_RICCO|nr:ankyrin repeat-containing protein, putative [Ricinus communis]